MPLDPLSPGCAGGEGWGEGALLALPSAHSGNRGDLYGKRCIIG
jgi:hypothetical protein